MSQLNENEVVTEMPSSDDILRAAGLGQLDKLQEYEDLVMGKAEPTPSGSETIEVAPALESVEGVTTEEPAEDPYLARRLELEAQVARLQAQVAPTAEQTQTEQVSELRRPVLPEVPELPDDPLEYTAEDLATQRKYNADLRQFYADSLEYTEQLANRPNAKLEAFEQHAKQESEAKRAEASANSAWESIRGFQRESGEAFMTSRDIVEVHNELTKAVELLLTAGGVTPASPDYAKVKADVEKRFVEAEPNLMEYARVNGIVRSADVDQYARVSEVVAYRQQAVQDGRLGVKSSLKAAYINQLEESGELSSLISKTEVDARRRANMARGEAIKGSQSAPVLPSNSNAVAQGSAVRFTNEELKFLEKVNSGKPLWGLTPEELALSESIERKQSS